MATYCCSEISVASFAYKRMQFSRLLKTASFLLSCLLQKFVTYYPLLSSMFNYLREISGHNADDFDIQASTWALSI